jgi:hypothetical protein
MNPFAARPTLKSDVVSTSGTYTGAPNPPKFVLRPSALSAHPLNNKNDGNIFFKKQNRALCFRYKVSESHAPHCFGFDSFQSLKNISNEDAIV